MSGIIQTLLGHVNNCAKIHATVQGGRDDCVYGVQAPLVGAATAPGGHDSLAAGRVRGRHTLRPVNPSPPNTRPFDPSRTTGQQTMLVLEQARTQVYHAGPPAGLRPH